MKTRLRVAFVVVCSAAAAIILAGCPGNKPITPIITSVGRSVATIARPSASGNIGASECQPNPTPPAPPTAANFFNALPPSNRNFPFAGFEMWRNTDVGCTVSRLDVYRALVTFNMASVSNLKGLVTKAELIVNVRAAPASPGAIITFPGVVTVTCPTLFGGAGALERFGPAQAAALPTLSSQGSIIVLGMTDPFPTSSGTVYTFPSSLVPGPVAGALNPTTVSANGTGGVVFTSDVTNSVNAALNGGHAGMSWMLTSRFEGPLPGPVPPAGIMDCKTSYGFDLQLTHY